MTGCPSNEPTVRPSTNGPAALDGAIVRTDHPEADGCRPSRRTGDADDGGQRASDGPASDATSVPGMTRPTDRPKRVENPEPRWLKYGLNAALWIESGVATLMASNGQLGFAAWANIQGVAQYGVPIILECFAVVLLLLGYQQGRRKRSPYPLWLLAGAVGGFAIYTNVVHAGHRAGLVYGAASAAALISWFVKLRLDLTHYLVDIGHLPPRRPRLGALMLTNRRLAVRAQLIAIERRLTDTDEIVTLAGVFLAVYDDTRTYLLDKGTEPRKAKRLAKRTAWRLIYRMSGAPVVDLPQAAEIETVDITIRTADELPVPPKVGEPLPEPLPEPADSDRQPDTDVSSGADRPRPRKPSGRKPSASERPGVRLVWSETVRLNAKALRDQFPDGLPMHRGNVSGRQVRDAMGWSNDKAAPAIQAYLAGADREHRAKSGDRSDDKEEVRSA